MFKICKKHILPVLVLGLGIALSPFLPGFAMAACGSPGNIKYISDLARLTTPLKVVIGPSESVYVADYIGNAVFVYNNKGALIKSIPVNSPRSVAVSPDGKIYVGTTNSVTLLAQNADGSLGSKVFAAGFSFVSDIAVSSDGRVFVLDGTFNRVKTYGADGTFIKEFGYGTLNQPMALAIDEVNGRLIVTDQKSYKVRIYSLSNYSLLYSFGTVQTNGNVVGGQFNFLQGVAVDRNGKIYVVDSGPDRIQVFDSSYTFLGTIGFHGSGPGSLDMPVDVAVDRYGRIYAASLSDGRISVFKDEVIVNPIAQRPADSSTTLSSTPVFTLTNGCINDLPLTYEFQVSTDSAFGKIAASNPSVAQGSGTTTWKSPALTDNSSYYWRARATDGLVYTGWTQPFSFKMNKVQFSPRGEELVSENMAGTNSAPVLASDEKTGKVWMAWHGNGEGVYNIYARAFDAVKETWGPVSRLTSGSIDHAKPAIALANDGRIWLSWEESGSIVIGAHDPATDLWSQPAPVSQGVTESKNSKLAINTATGALAVAWDGKDANGEAAVFISRYNAGQNTWGAAERVTTSVLASEPSVVYDAAGRLWVAWKKTDVATGNNDIYARIFDPVSGTWSAELAVANGPAINENSGRVITDQNSDAWFVYVTNGRIAAKKYIYSTSTFGSEVLVSDGTADANPATLIDHSGKMWILWDGDKGGSRGVYGKFLEGGAWSDYTLITDSASNDSRPSVSLYMNKVYTAWESDRNGNINVFTKSFYVDDLPTAPTLVSPLKGEVLETQNPTLTISKADDPDTAVLSYEFQVDTANTFNSPALIRSGLIIGYDALITWFPGTLNNKRTYYWRARAFDGEGYGPWSDVGNFKVLINHPPVINSYYPGNPTPTVNYGDSLRFGVVASDPDGDPLTYQWILDGQTVSTTADYLFVPGSQKGIYNLSVTVSDGLLTSKSVNWVITVMWNGTLSLATDPAGAKVYIDGNYGYLGRYIGDTPLDIKGLTVGVHSFALVMPGHETIYKQINIAGAENITFDYKLKRAKRIDTESGVPLLLSDGTKLTVNGRAVPFVVDWNNDGSKDLIVGTGDGKVALYTSEAASELRGDEGRKLFAKGFLATADGVAITVVYNAAPFVVDWNNDGRKDLLVGGGDGRIRLYLNIGTEAAPLFATPVILRDGGGEINVAGNAFPSVVDYDNDGRKDLVVGSSDGAVRLYINSGTDASPAFTSPVSITVDGADIKTSGNAKPFFVDWNSDGKKDIVAGDTGSGRLFFNNGADEAPSFLGVTALKSWVKKIKHDRRNRDFMAYLGYNKDMNDYIGQIKGASVFVVNWDDKGARDIVVGTEDGSVMLYQSGD